MQAIGPTICVSRCASTRPCAARWQTDIAVFLEVHPTQVLLRPMQEVLTHAGMDGAVYPSLQRDADGPAALLRSLGNLYLHGYPVCLGGRLCGRRVPCRPAADALAKTPLLAAQRQPAGDHRPRPLPAGPGRHPLLGCHIRSAAQPDTYIVETELGSRPPALPGRPSGIRRCRAACRRVYRAGVGDCPGDRTDRENMRWRTLPLKKRSCCPSRAPSCSRSQSLQRRRRSRLSITAARSMPAPLPAPGQPGCCTPRGIVRLEAADERTAAGPRAIAGGIPGRGGSHSHKNGPLPDDGGPRA